MFLFSSYHVKAAEGGFISTIDINSNGVIDVLDIAALSQKYNVLKGQAQWDSNYDLNGDGAIDIYDIAILSSHIGDTVAKNFYAADIQGTYDIVTKIKVQAGADDSLHIVNYPGSVSESMNQTDLSWSVSGPGAQIVTDSDGRKEFVIDTKVTAGQILEYTFTRSVKNNSVRYTTDLSNTSGNYKGYSLYKYYTSPQEKIESSDTAIIDKAKELFNGITNPYLKAKKAFEFVNLYMTYDIDDAYSNKGALSALTYGKGVCEDYAELMVALLRASGVPARVVTGYWAESGAFQNGQALASNYAHAWPEFYLPEYGWVAAEPTYTYTVSGVKTVDYSYFANMVNPDHFLAGYNPVGENPDMSMTWSGYNLQFINVTDSVIVYNK